MQIYLARDGAEIGDYSRAQLGDLARAGELQPTDHYWHEGMADWLLLGDLLGSDAWKPLPPARFYQHRLAVPIAIGGAFVVAGLLAIVIINVSNSEKTAKAAVSRSASATRAGEGADEIRDKAAADLRRKIDRLPGQATSPLNAFYYDVRVNMNKSLDPRAPWTATITGGENFVDPASDETVRRTQFTITAEYHDGEWAFRHYRATSVDLANSTTTEIEDDEDAPTPPSLVGMLGLKREPRR